MIVGNEFLGHGQVWGKLKLRKMRRCYNLEIDYLPRYMHCICNMFFLDAKARQKACLIDLGGLGQGSRLQAGLCRAVPGSAGLCLLFFGLSKALLA